MIHYNFIRNHGSTGKTPAEQAVYETVVDTLYKKYHCYIPYCYEKPEYLKAVLKDLYGASYKEIINSIEQHLGEFTHNKEVKEFLQAL